MMILLDGYSINNHIQVTVIIHQQYHHLHHHGFKHQLISHEKRKKTSFNLSALSNLCVCLSFVCGYMVPLHFVLIMCNILFKVLSFCLLIIRMNKKKNILKIKHMCSYDWERKNNPLDLVCFFFKLKYIRYTNETKRHLLIKLI